MPTYFPCPNPACTYQFDAEQLPAAAMVTCPICRTRFPYRAATAPAPVRADSYGNQPSDSQFGSTAAAEPRSTRPNRLVTPRNLPKSSKSNTALMALGAAVVVAVLAICIILALRGNPLVDKKKPEEIHSYDEGNFKFATFDPEVWNKDVQLTNALGVTGFAYRRKNPDAWVVIHYHDFKTRKARQDEMRNELLGMLRGGMKNVQKEAREALKLGEHSEGISFTANYGEPVLELYGEAYTFDRHGFGYVLMFFSTSSAFEAARNELYRYKDSFTFMDRRKDWQETEPSALPLFEKDSNYELTDPNRVWIKARVLGDDEKAKGREWVTTKENLKEHDPKATMLLKMSAPVVNPKLQRDAPKADAIVFELDKAGGDALDAARKHVEKWLERDEGKVTFSPNPKTISGAPLPQSNASLGIFSSANDVDRSNKKYFALSALPLGDKLIVVAAYCKEIDAEIFEPFLLNLAASIRERR